MIEELWRFCFRSGLAEFTQCPKQYILWVNHTSLVYSDLLFPFLFPTSFIWGFRVTRGACTPVIRLEKLRSQDAAAAAAAAAAATIATAPNAAST